MNQQAAYTFKGMNQDVTKSKASNEFYFEGNNIRITSTDSQSTGSITNEKGNKLVLSIPTPVVNIGTSTITYGNKSLQFTGGTIKHIPEIVKQYTGKTSGEQIIIGHTNSRSSIIVFTTDNNGFDCVWEVIETEGVFDITLRYMRNLNFSTSRPIQAVFNFENDRIQKVYWVDGESQLRFLNLNHSLENENTENLIDVNSNTINIVGTFEITQPQVVDIVSGGNHTAGMIQYAYNLYRLNSSQTKLSPLSRLVPLDKGVNQGGGKVNEVVGSTPIVRIENLDPEYTHIKVYAVKYTSYNQIPSISLIKDQEINSTRALDVFDDGNVINDISMAEFLFLGSDPISPKHIESKDNILFSANIREQAFDVDLDTRAYSFNSTGVAKIYNNVALKKVATNVQTDEQPPLIVHPDFEEIYLGEMGDQRLRYPTLEDMIPDPNWTPTYVTNTVDTIIGEELTVPNSYAVDFNHDAVNKDYDTYKFQKNGVTLGGEGKYIKYEIVQSEDISDPEGTKVFKDYEIYRLGIHFYNRLGQKSLPKWMADFRAPEGNLEGKYNTLKVTLKPEFYVWLNTSSNFESEDDKPVGYRILRADRTLNDRTIITQGFLNSMMSNIRAENKSDEISEFSAQAKQRAQEGNKLPSMQRVFGNHHTQMRPAKHIQKLDPFYGNSENREVHKAGSSSNWLAETFQFNTIIQMFGPDIMFGNVSMYNGLELRIKGANKRSSTQFWGQTRRPATKEINREGKVLNGLTPHEDITQPNTGELTITGVLNHMCDVGIFGPAGGEEDNEMDFYQFYRAFNGGYVKSTGKSYPIYGKPLVVERGQGKTTYNNDAKFTFYNSLEPMVIDGGDGRGENSAAITSVNSWGAKCITTVLGPNNREFDATNRPKLETLWSESGIADSNVMLVGEFVKNKQQIYLGGIYGGNSFEDKKRSNYIEIGQYNKINVSLSTILDPGDTFVQTFKFAKIAKTDTEVYNSTSLQITEIVEGKVETSIDLRNRNDISLGGWDSRFQPRYDEFHEYNRVYSQQPTLAMSRDVDYNFRRIKNFDTRIMASKIKVPGEYIDSWTDMLVNETQDLNGKNGPITSLVSFKDNIFAFQDTALAAIGINPRVQVQGGDGIAIELGSGGILHDYKYVTTTSGSINKWGVIATDKAIYYLDVLNKSFCRYTGQVEKISDTLGMHTWFNNNLNTAHLRLDNPVLGTGVCLGYDMINDDVLLSLHQTNKHTLLFNQSANQGFGGFISLMDYCPSRYMYRDNALFSLDLTNRNIYQHFLGEYNMFYGIYYPSYVTLSVNPAVNMNCVFDNVEYNSEIYLNGLDQFDKTLTHIHAYNEYQDSGKVPLVFGRDKNLRRKFRTWRADVPRQGRERIRNPWIYLKLELENNNNYKMILHDIIVNFTAS